VLRVLVSIWDYSWVIKDRVDVTVSVNVWDWVGFTDR